jgi:tryptophan halogenase
MNKINSMCIVGGGSAGWMTASTLIKFFPDKKITLIESDSVGRIGVGESTLPTLMAWCNALGIDHHDFMRDTDASYKLSISFKNFYKNDGSSFHYPFGNPYKTNSFLENGNDWHVSKILDKSLPIKNYTESFFPQMNLINENKISSKEVDGFSLKKDSALHFNAMKFADWLRDNYAVPRGVSHIIANIDKVNAANKFREILSGIWYPVLNTNVKIKRTKPCSTRNVIYRPKTLSLIFDSPIIRIIII